MCVIFVAMTNRPTDEMIERGHEQNSYGAGFAWREENEVDGEVRRVVRWAKGINDIQEMKDLARSLPLPFISHFRIPSVGANCPELTHPFVVDAEATEDILEGSSLEPVLFHNGTWTGWKNFVLDFCAKTGTRLPEGKWSDTRAMAFVAYHLGLGILELIDEKIAILGKDAGSCRILGSGWTLKNGVHCSNTYWERTTSPYTTPPASYSGSQANVRFPRVGGAQAGEAAKSASTETKPPVSASPAPAGGNGGGPAGDAPFHAAILLETRVREEAERRKWNYPTLTKNQRRRIMGHLDKVIARELAEAERKTTILGPVVH